MRLVYFVLDAQPCADKFQCWMVNHSHMYFNLESQSFALIFQYWKVCPLQHIFCVERLALRIYYFYVGSLTMRTQVLNLKHQFFMRITFARKWQVIQKLFFSLKIKDDVLKPVTSITSKNIGSISSHISRSQRFISNYCDM